MCRGLLPLSATMCLHNFLTNAATGKVRPHARSMPDKQTKPKADVGTIWQVALLFYTAQRTSQQELNTLNSSVTTQQYIMWR